MLVVSLFLYNFARKGLYSLNLCILILTFSILLIISSNNYDLIGILKIL